MIKYETNLEEAKKIKELGYDFSFCCEKFFYDADDEIWVYNRRYTTSGKLLTTNERVRILNFGAEDSMLCEHCIPIIPYPILEACCFRYCTTRSTSYEDFVYCVENYPEETKARFNELKEQYTNDNQKFF